jgi:hypothetical protein
VPKSQREKTNQGLQSPYLGFIAASAGCLDKVLKEGLARIPRLTNGVNGGHHF